MKITDWKSIERKLTNEAKKFLIDAYGIQLDIPVRVNGRLKSTHGVFKHKSSRKESMSIEIGKTYIENHPWETVYSTLKHECIHYYLYERDLPYKDGHPYFENELKKHGSHSTGTVRYKGKVVEYVCTADGCKTTYRKKKRYPRNGQGYRSGCCKAPIKFVGEKII
jgi:SprT-like protein